jgi:hypothetical protein
MAGADFKVNTWSIALLKASWVANRQIVSDATLHESHAECPVVVGVSHPYMAVSGQRMGPKTLFYMVFFDMCLTFIDKTDIEKQ